MRDKIEMVLGYITAICFAVMVWCIVPWLCIGFAASLILVGIASGIKYVWKQIRTKILHTN